MGMQLNIKDPETIRLARALADASGTSLTQTVRLALQRAATDRAATIEDKLRRADAIVDGFQRDMPEHLRGKTSKEVMDAIYDDEQEDGFAR